MSLAEFKIVASEIGRGSEIVVNGEDVSRVVRRARLDLDAGANITTLTLEVMGGGEITGQGIVRVVEPSGDPKVAVEDFLRQVNPDELDQLLLSGSVDEPFNTARVIDALLQVLRGA